MQLGELNAASTDEATALVRGWADVPAWAAAVVGARPYADVPALRAAAAAYADAWTPEEVTAALAGHPRIGERAAGDGASAAMSRAEQAGVPEDDDVLARLAEGNRRYEETFGRIYLVRAKGRSAEEMLALLEQRLRHDPDTELLVTMGQLKEIAMLRLDDSVTP
ncbi:2-oxo-4-hydroxy-4-carboxy-5-ureidoimidazoline decarboxylase [Nocardioides sp. cx-173]|uniref:2-oxo-4-hydroxy-4-carboxy-5-ureidoimidazoline decarboxylase n=1 Tax=Nocardioides sp. cx-173 TaxID=2898796 RepID=UPI001E5C7C90|nr:2-oxo-4-hydroxy-4-carboxy-5-ureidoimidazoline decarboxylase [Nocardioides sp. cx-173]MCD4525599.1 2-oxo-4-hydroxy-4-carboxy-5-ureidoimidazoline decarboxylase [Nocardioides sp. cx-173]UGB42743.1 2-oxo-4-hydroxy-4-carboxy-5-ureidoimidazoline decarboxylase [Nocardioides sp. cx-173]